MGNKSSSSEQHTSSCKYKGVRKRKWGKWVSEIRLPNSRQRIWLGSYDSPEKAARAFDAAQFCLRGRSAKFNFPEINPPEIAGGRSMTPAEIQAAAARFANMANDTVQMNGHEQNQRDDDRELENLTAEDSITYSPSMSDGATVHIDSSDVRGVETSLQEQLSLSTTLGSGSYVSDFGYLPGFEDLTGGEFYQASQPTNNFANYSGDDDAYAVSLYQGSYLWNF